VTAGRSAFGPGDGQARRSDDRQLKHELRATERIERQAYETGLAGVAYDAAMWPTGADTRTAYDAGCDDRKRARRARRRALVLGAAGWGGRHLAPRTARRLRRAGRRWHRVRATIRGSR